MCSAIRTSGNSFASTVTLAPSGNVRVCRGENQQFMCSSSSIVIWSIFGFGSGVLDTSNPVSALFYAAINDRVETSDTSALTNPSTLTFQNIGYTDDNATITCLNATLTGAMTSTIQVGESTLNSACTGLKQWLHLGNVLHDTQWFFCFALCRHYNII